MVQVQHCEGWEGTVDRQHHGQGVEGGKGQAGGSGRSSREGVRWRAADMAGPSVGRHKGIGVAKKKKSSKLKQRGVKGLRKELWKSDF